MATHETTTKADPISFAALLEQALTEPGTISAAYTAFHNYSFGNQLLAMSQCAARNIPLGPIATFPKWKDLGRFVRKGEKAIVLCQPVTIKTKRDRGTAYLLERIPPALYADMQARCEREGRSVRFVLLRLMALYAAKGLDALERK